MSKLLRAAIALSFLLTTAGVTHAQNVAMSGEYGESSGRLVNIPINPPKAVCTNTFSARCHAGARNGVPDQLLEPSSGVPVGGAGVIIMPGGLAEGDRFTIPTLAFIQDAVHKFTPVINNIAIVQLDTTLTAAMPRFERKQNPQTGTRVFRPNAWSRPGNGQTGRIAANTTPISTATQATHAITLKYIAGQRAFGGTMANLLDGDGKLYLTGPALMSSFGSPATRPWVGTNALADGIQGNLNTRNGAGWGYTRMGAQQSGVIRNLQVIAPPCTQEVPPAPAGCGLVSNFLGNGFTIAAIPGATSTKFMHPWTTGTVSILFTGTQGGFPNNQLLTGMGYDSTSMTGAVRNIGMVAGSYTLRNSAAGTLSGQQMIGVDMTFTPEPGATVALIGGLGLLGFLARRRA